MRSIFLSLLFSFFLFSSLFAIQKSPQFEQGYPLEENERFAAYNATARKAPCNCFGYYASFSYLFWEARQDGLDLAVKAPLVLNEEISSHIEHMEFAYSSGFKIGIGNQFPYDHWNTSFEYTRYHVTDKTNKEAPFGYTYKPVWTKEFELGIDSPVYSGEWKLGYDMIDLALTRPSYVGKYFQVTPFMALRGGWIDQDLDMQYSRDGIDTIYTDASIDSWLLGPRIGIDNRFLLGKYCRLFAHISTSLLYQKFTTKIREENPKDTQILLQKENRSNLTPNLDIYLGLGWGNFFSKDRFHFSLNARYDLLYFWQQNKMRSLLDEINFQTDSPAKGLALHGLTLQVLFDF